MRRSDPDAMMAACARFEGRTLGALSSPEEAERHAKAMEWARARAADPVPDPEPGPKWWEYDGSDHAPDEPT